MYALFTAHVLVEYDRTNEGDYEKRKYSVDCEKEDLAFLALLPTLGVTGNEEEILEVGIYPPGLPDLVASCGHFDSVAKLISHFNSIKFKNKLHSTPRT